MIHIDEKIAHIFSEILGLNFSEIKKDISRDTTPEWDSLNHLMLLTEIEKEFKMKFKAAEITKIKTLQDIETILKYRGS
ncbi:MAG TPA: acyl carrier protein [Deltaproteobacteria bacterium]|nr:acyl carrier protein [Deltaproteobacteria bacterium]HIJ18885.1 acyl carrier protein [Candidatus Woesearchaeota archaeon]HLC96971.1 acyl carrier protein [Candidatus Nanoarchaeia archaeon]